jgi:Rha family phage regulatory protein
MSDLVIHSRNENWTTSNLIAEHFGKSHDFLLKKIRKLLAELEDLTRLNKRVKNNNTKFISEKYLAENGHEYERYRLNKPAFSLLIMQMSGKEVLQVQDKFNQAFYDMENYILKLKNTEFLAAREQGKIARLEVTDSIKELVDYATAQGSKHAQFYYSTITKETYKALGFLAQGEKVGSDFRNHLDKFQLHELVMAEAWASRIIEQGITDKLHYKEIYLLAKQKVCEFGRFTASLRITNVKGNFMNNSTLCTGLFRSIAYSVLGHAIEPEGSTPSPCFQSS